MDDRLDPVLLEREADQVGIGDVGVHEGGALGHRVAMAGAQVVDDHHPMAALEQRFGAHGADVAGTAGDEYVHGAPPAGMLPAMPAAPPRRPSARGPT